jgi:hypothetical protein
LSFVPGSFNAQGWLDWFEFNGRAQLAKVNGAQLLFRDWLSVGPGNIASFTIANNVAGMSVWDITEPLQPQIINGIVNGNNFIFTADAQRLHEYVAFTVADAFIPKAIGKIAAQDLHNTTPADYLIISYPAFIQQAQRLADFHKQHDAYTYNVVSTDQVYNEFSSGNTDPVAVRDFVKMYFDKYGTDPAKKPKYLLLFGDASYDYKDRLKNNTNYVPAWETSLSLDPLSTYASDDFFGFLGDQEDINSGLVSNDLDIGIGRVPAKNMDEAKNFVDKLISYYAPTSFGPWRNNLSFIADDEDQDLHLQDAEIISNTATQTAPLFNTRKIYLDAFHQESGAGGSQYPEANLAIDNQVYNGTLILNYNGHGGANRLAEETILDQSIVNKWNNPGKLPLMITATCDFAPYDNPALNSLGENLLIRPKTGAIALMTTTRVVFASSNRIMNDNYIRYAMQRDANGRYRTLGDAMKDAKNFTYQTSPDISNNRKFTLLGDPATTIGFPSMNVSITRVNGLPSNQADTLSATEKIVMEGRINDLQGNLLNSFNGFVYPVLFDKPATIQTLGNDASSPVTTFSAQSNVLFRGKASVTGGLFHFEFRMPKDINYQYGKGRLSLYANTDLSDANGLFNEFLIGGIFSGAGNDTEGPKINAWLNDEKFVNGGITGDKPLLILKLSDSSGINTSGIGIGHDIIATLDDDNRTYYKLNDFFEASLNNYQEGIVQFQMPELAPGTHHLKIKAWDVMNNSSEVILEFTIIKNEELVLAHVLNYPNPFSTATQFWFEHNKPGQNLEVNLQIMTVSGSIIKVIKKTINNIGNRSSDLEWNGRDEYGEKVGRGVYIYRLSVKSGGGQPRVKIEKLVIL